MTERHHDTDSQHQSNQALRNGDHNHGLQDLTATIVAIKRPLRSVLRLSAHMPGLAGDANWALPNTALRIHLETPQGEVSRIYTVRHVDLAADVFHFDIVLHPHASLMMLWAGARVVGDTFRVTGPRPQATVPVANDRRVALFADDSAIPALDTLLRTLPVDTHGVGWVATDDTAAFGELPAPAGLSLLRLDATNTGEVASAPLVRQALALGNPAHHVVWGAGERDQMRLIRQHFRNAGLAKEDVAAAGYWKRGATNTEIDQHRLAAYRRVIAEGGTLQDYDDLAIGI